MFKAHRDDTEPKRRGERQARVLGRSRATLSPAPPRNQGDHQRSPGGGDTLRPLHVLAILLTGAVAALATLYLVGPRPEEIRGGGLDQGEAASQATPTATPQAELSYEGPFEAGQIVRIINTGACLNARTYPSVSAPVWSCLPDGSELRLVVGPIYSDTMWWWAAAEQGWVAEPYLALTEEETQ